MTTAASPTPDGPPTRRRGSGEGTVQVSRPCDGWPAAPRFTCEPHGTHPLGAFSWMQRHSPPRDRGARRVRPDVHRTRRNRSPSNPRGQPLRGTRRASAPPHLGRVRAARRRPPPASSPASSRCSAELDESTWASAPASRSRSAGSLYGATDTRTSCPSVPGTDRDLDPELVEQAALDLLRVAGGQPEGSHLQRLVRRRAARIRRSASRRVPRGAARGTPRRARASGRTRSRREPRGRRRGRACSASRGGGRTPESG